MPPRVPHGSRVLTRQMAPAAGLCMLAVNGVPCPKPTRFRGVCATHFQYLQTTRRLDELALPSKAGQKHVIVLKDHPDPGICRLVVNGEPCLSPGTRRGLCAKHYGSIWQRSDLSLDDFCLPPLPQRVALREHTSAAACRASDAGVDCAAPPISRGLCHRHYALLQAHPSLLEPVALPKAPLVEYSLRHRLKEGQCRVAEHGVGCGERAAARGLCRRHAGALRHRPEALAAIALPAAPKVRIGFSKAADAGDAPMCCVVVENGLRCSGPPERRGVCRRHHKILGNHADYSLLDFYLPERPTVLSRKPPEEVTDGLCVVLEDGVPCTRPPHVRGLCKGHYRRVEKTGQLEALAHPVRTGQNPFGAGNDRPHVYVDKNVLYDHADHEVFGSGGQDASVLLVEAIRAGRVRGSVSVDGVKSVYSHVRYRLQRPTDDGGRGASDAEAEDRARAYVEATFYREGAWRVVPLDAQAFARVVAAKDRLLSLEDALEFQCYQQARIGKAGPTMFVTRDTDFPEGVHPTHVVRAQGLGGGTKR